MNLFESLEFSIDFLGSCMQVANHYEIKKKKE